MAVIKGKSFTNPEILSAELSGELKFTWKVASNFLQGFLIAILFLLTFWGWKFLTYKFALNNDIFCSAIGNILAGTGTIVFLIYLITGVILLIKNAWRIVR